jgi:hypothetical protein
MIYWAINMLNIFKPRLSLAADKEAKKSVSTNETSLQRKKFTTD